VLERTVDGRQKARGMDRPEKREGKAEQQIKTPSQRRHLKASPIFSDCL
jgi:hypothetical protein